MHVHMAYGADRWVIDMMKINNICILDWTRLGLLTAPLDKQDFHETYCIPYCCYFIAFVKHSMKANIRVRTLVTIRKFSSACGTISYYSNYHPAALSIQDSTPCKRHQAICYMQFTIFKSMQVFPKFQPLLLLLSISTTLLIFTCTDVADYSYLSGAPLHITYIER